MERLDNYLVREGLTPTRSQARAAILAGAVEINGSPALKSGAEVKEGDEVKLRFCPCPYVSRGGLKLERALKRFSIDLTGLTVCDLGSSTGGFTDCALKAGAARVTAVDSGTAQLHPSLRSDPRVVCRENTNARYLSAGDIGGEVDFLCADLSFISLRLVMPAVRRLVRPGGRAVLLIKPQFEAGRAALSKKGVVREESDRLRAVESVVSCARENGFEPEGVEPSPIRGGDGNIEYLLSLR